MDIQSAEAIRIAEKLGLDLSLLKPPKEEKGREEQEKPITEFRLVRAIGTCALCKSTIVQYIKLGRKSVNLWVTVEEDVSNEEVDKFSNIEEYKTRLRTCFLCEFTLMTAWEKKDLVKYILDLVGPEVSRKELVRRIAKARKQDDYKTYEGSF